MTFTHNVRLQPSRTMTMASLRLFLLVLALMGHRSEIRVHAAWSEPPVLWVIVGAGAGTRKSAALRQVLAPLLALADDRKQQQQQQQQGLVTAGLQLPVVYTGRSAFPLFSVGLPAFSVLSVCPSVGQCGKGVHCTLCVLLLLVCVCVLAGLGVRCVCIYVLPLRPAYCCVAFTYSSFDLAVQLC